MHLPGRISLLLTMALLASPLPNAVHAIMAPFSSVAPPADTWGMAGATAGRTNANLGETTLNAKTFGGLQLDQIQQQLISSIEPVVSKDIGVMPDVYAESYQGFSGSTGEILWTYRTNGSLVSGTSAALDNNLVFLPAMNEVTALNARTGQPQWTYPSEFTPFLDATTPLIQNGVVYVHAQAKVVALNEKTGALQWTSGQQTQSTFPLASDGKLLYTDCGPYGVSYDQLCALNPTNGQVTWTTTISNATYYVAVATSQYLMVGAKLADGSSQLQTFSAGTHHLLWSYPLVASTKFAADEATVYANCDTTHLCALDIKTGHLRWSVSLAGYIAASFAGGLLYAVTGAPMGGLSVFDAATGKLRWTMSNDLLANGIQEQGEWRAVAAAPPVVTQGHVYIIVTNAGLAILSEPQVAVAFSSPQIPTPLYTARSSIPITVTVTHNGQPLQGEHGQAALFIPRGPLTFPIKATSQPGQYVTTLSIPPLMAPPPGLYTVTVTSRDHHYGKGSIATTIAITKATSTSSSDWLQPGYDATRRFYNPGVTDINAKTVSQLQRGWSLAQFGGGLRLATTTRVVATDGNNLSSVSAETGVIQWQTSAGSAGSPSIANGQLWLANKGIHRLDLASGAYLGSFGEQSYDSGIAMVSGTIYARLSAYTGVDALNATSGKVLWTYRSSSTGKTPYVTPAATVAGNGMVYTTLYTSASSAFDMVALDAQTGKARWSYRDNSFQNSYLTCMLAGQHLIIINASDIMYSLNASTGKLEWRAKLLPKGGTSGFDAATDGARIIVNGQSLSSFDVATGKLLWRSSDTARGTSLLAGGLAFAPCTLSTTETLCAYNPATGQRLWQDPTGFSFGNFVGIIITQRGLYVNTLEAVIQIKLP